MARRLTERDFRFPLNPEEADWLRVRYQSERGIIRRFTVQYEAIIDSRTYPAIRYDTAHGFVHRDLLDQTGRVIDKLPLSATTYNEAMTDAINDIKTNWTTYRAEFDRRWR